jgi:alpha-L-fucosidase
MIRIGFVLIFLAIVSLTINAQPKPTANQLAWQQWETTAFLHFTVNTYTDKEWGDGTESPQIVNPTDFDALKMVQTLKEAGFKLVLITAKHHDGFCLWQTKTTEHCVRNSPYKNGKGDIVGELAAACKTLGLKFGVYLSPWDRHEPKYGTAAYNDFYKTQLRELLTNYGEISEVWFDGAKGDSTKMEYDFKGFWGLVRQLQPKAVMFSDVGPDVRWVGNESGNAGETCWSMLTISDAKKEDVKGKAIAPGIADEKYLNVGDPNGTSWIPAETDVSIRPGWFWHEKENEKVKTAKELVNLYYKSVGRNSLLLLNIPPNRKGQLSEKDVESIKGMRAILDETFKTNLVKNKTKGFLTDSKMQTVHPLSINVPFIIDLQKKTSFDRFMLQEDIASGQRIESAKLEYWNGKTWQLVQTFTTVGYKRLLRFEPIETAKLKLTILKAKTNSVMLSEIGIYKASTNE